MEKEVEINISNKNSDGDVVLNDLKLLELIINYPFLYNSYVRPQNDNDYIEWAWDNIAMSLNNSYIDSDLLEPITKNQLKARWEELKPIISSLMKARDAIPSELQQIISKMHVHRQFSEQKPNTYKGEQSDVEKLIYDNIQFVERMPHRLRKNLEAEVLDILLNTELKICGTGNLVETEKERIQMECDSFLKNICFTSLSSYCYPNSKIKIAHNGDNDANLCFADNHTTSQYEQQNGVEFKPSALELSTNSSNSNANIDLPLEQCVKYEIQMLQQPKIINEDVKILQNPSTSRFGPFLIKKCRVRIKRIVFNNSIPLGRRSSLRKTR